MRLKEAIEKFTQYGSFKYQSRTIQGYNMSLRYFCMYLRDPEIENITLDHCLEWLQWFEDMKFDRNTIQKKSIALRKFFEFYGLQSADIINWYLIPLPKRHFKFPRVASKENYQKLLSVIPKNSGYYWHVRNRALFMIIWDSGARLGEVISLNLQDLDLEKMEATIMTEKSHGMMPIRKIFWTQATNSTLKKWIKRRARELNMWNLKSIEDQDALFMSIHGGKGSVIATARRMDISAVTELVRKYSNKAGLERPLNPHSMRHAMGRYLAENGASNSVISSILGHSSLPSSYIYTLPTGKDLERTYRKLIKRR